MDVLYEKITELNDKLTSIIEQVDEYDSVTINSVCAIVDQTNEMLDYCDAHREVHPTHRETPDGGHGRTRTRTRIGGPNPFGVTRGGNHISGGTTHEFRTPSLPRLVEPIVNALGNQNFSFYQGSGSGGGVDLFFSGTVTGDSDGPGGIMSNLLGDLFRDLGHLGVQSHTATQDDVVVSLPQELVQMLEVGDEQQIKTNPQAQIQEDCSICKVDYEESDRLKILPCYHVYHQQCIDRWFEQSVHCPICRKDIREFY